MQPSFSGLLVTCAYLPQTTLPPGVTSPSSLTFTCAHHVPAHQAPAIAPSWRTHHLAHAANMHTPRESIE